MSSERVRTTLRTKDVAWPPNDDPLAVYPFRHDVPIAREFVEPLLSVSRHNPEGMASIAGPLRRAGERYMRRHLVDAYLQVDEPDWGRAFRRGVVQPLRQEGVITDWEVEKLMRATRSGTPADPRFVAFRKGLSNAVRAFELDVSDKVPVLADALGRSMEEIEVAGLCARGAVLLFTDGASIYAVFTKGAREEFGRSYLRKLVGWIRDGRVQQSDGPEPVELAELRYQVESRLGRASPESTTPAFGWTFEEAVAVCADEAQGEMELLGDAADHLNRDRLAVYGVAQRVSGFDHDDHRIVRVDHWAPRWAETLHVGSLEALGLPEGAPPLSSASRSYGFSVTTGATVRPDQPAEVPSMDEGRRRPSTAEERSAEQLTVGL